MQRKRADLMKSDIYSIESIGSGFLAAMAKPVPGEDIGNEFADISRAGIKQIVSLLEAHEANEAGLKDENLLTTQNGMRFVSYPIKDRSLPESVVAFSKFTKDLYHQIAGGRSTVIHCWAGIGRTGIVAAGVLLHCGFSTKEAFDHISLHRGLQVPDTMEQYNWIQQNERIIVNTNK